MEFNLARYQIVFFADNLVKSNDKTLIKLSDIAKNFVMTSEELISEVAYEKRVGDLNTALFPRAQLRTKSKEWKIPFLPDKVVFEHILPEGEKKGPEAFLEICNAVISAYKSLATEFVIEKSRRLGITVIYTLDKVPSLLINKVYGSLFKLPEILLPLEWTWQRCFQDFVRVHELEEELNVITNMQAGALYKEGETKPGSHKAIEVVINVNTIMGNRNPRFEQAHLERFFSQAASIQKTKMEQIQRLLLS
jgi:hypothetical protein